jgi:diguanylate cyclase (GGDEF)-like protein
MAERSQKRRKFRLGLAGRVALIACASAVVATLAQWVSTPIMMRNEFEQARLVYAASAAEQLATIVAAPAARADEQRLQELVDMMAAPLPFGQAAFIAPDGHVLAASAGAATYYRSLEPDLTKTAGRVARIRGRARLSLHPVIVDGQRIGSVMVVFTPKSMIASWFAIVWRNALVLFLAILVLAPFLLPLARRALAPVSDLEHQIRLRAPNDKSRLADGVDDGVLKPLLSAIDEVHQRSEAAMRRALTMAFADPVTRLPNRLRFMSKLESLVDRGAGGAGAYLLICDLDGFRKVNVSLGPRVADSLLAAVAERLRVSATKAVPGGVFLGRIGADQFGLIVPGATRECVDELVSTAEKAVGEPMTLEGQTIRVTASFGAASAPEDAKTSADLMKQCEIALKEAKRLPAVRRAYYDHRLMEKARAQSRLETEVREGLERGEFVAVFQPKVKLETGELVGAEALARWRRPDGSVVSPGVFVPIAEETGLISKLGNCVMRDACFAAAQWNKKGIAQRIAVNVSPHQLDSPDFIASVYQALDDSGLDPRLLELEITESAAVSDPDRVARIMWPLRDRGVRLAIDDFGTGHSNFASITRLPFDVFKIDQQFIRALSSDPHAPAIVEMILAMAEALGQETVAEGVETKEQADFLLRRNCTIGQGYYYSPPLPAAEFDAFVRSWRPRPANKFAA